MKRLAVVMSLVLLACSGIVFLQANAAEQTDQGGLTAPDLEFGEAEGTELADPDALEPPGGKDPMEQLPEDGEIHATGGGGWSTDPCPPTNTCGPAGCFSLPPQLGQCTTSNTGVNGCGWDGSIQNPPEFSCPKNTTIHVRTCPCEAEPGQICQNDTRTLVCL